jgi:hypothetical protein
VTSTGASAVAVIARSRALQAYAQRVAEAINRQGPLPPLAADKARAPPAGTAQSRVVHFMQDRTEDGRRFRMLTVIDEFTRRCLPLSSRADSDPTTFYIASPSVCART